MTKVLARSSGFDDQPGKRFTWSPADRTRFQWTRALWEESSLDWRTRYVLLGIATYLKNHCDDGAWPSYEVDHDDIDIIKQVFREGLACPPEFPRHYWEVHEEELLKMGYEPTERMLKIMHEEAFEEDEAWKEKRLEEQRVHEAARERYEEWLDSKTIDEIERKLILNEYIEREDIDVFDESETVVALFQEKFPDSSYEAVKETIRRRDAQESRAEANPRSPASPKHPRRKRRQLFDEAAH